MIYCDVLKAYCEDVLWRYQSKPFDLTFLDPPFNQNKDYEGFNDKMEEVLYWEWLRGICELIYEHSSEGAAIYFMQREKNVHHVLETLEMTGWIFQNLIIWKKKSSAAAPSKFRLGKHYQIIAFATKGARSRVFNKLRIDPPLLETEKYRRPNGVYITDVWDDIRELTSGFYAGKEPLRSPEGARIHLQQSPVKLLTRVILSSTVVGDLVFDPFAGTGTTLIVARQLRRNALGVEQSARNFSVVRGRISTRKIRKQDNISPFREDYRFTENLDTIWPKRR